MITIDLAHRFTPEQRALIDAAALRAGTTPEGIAEAAILRALESSTASRAAFRLRMPDHARRKLEEHAAALGCDPGALALFLLRRRKPEMVQLSG